MEGRLRTKLEQFGKQVNNEAEEMGMLYGFPAACILEKPDNIVISDVVISALDVGFKKRDLAKNGTQHLLEAEMEEVPVDETPQDAKEDRLVFHTSWDTVLPWKGQLGRVEVYRDSVTQKYTKRFIAFGRIGVNKRLSYTLSTQVRYETYGNLAAERTANAVLKKLLSREQWISYKFTGCFWEISKRSGISYFIRKCRPTLVFREVERPPEGDEAGTMMDAIGALCLHPIGYHQKSFAGLMAPSDEVKNFVELIRINEKYLWRKAFHHSLREVESGL